MIEKKREFKLNSLRYFVLLGKKERKKIRIDKNGFCMYSWGRAGWATVAKGKCSLFTF
jgi:hypothetical protein